MKDVSRFQPVDSTPLSSLSQVTPRLGTQRDYFEMAKHPFFYTSNAATAGGSDTVTVLAAFLTSAAAVAGAGSWHQESNFFSIADTSCR